MQPLAFAFIPQSEHVAMFEALLAAWRKGDPQARASFPAPDERGARAAIRAFLRTMRADKVYRNDVYQVAVTTLEAAGVRLSIKRIDRQPVHDWRDLQEIKNQLVGPECEGVELYPAESRRVDTANQYYIFCVTDPTYRFPFGFTERHVTETTLGKSVNRPFANP